MAPRITPGTGWVSLVPTQLVAYHDLLGKLAAWCQYQRPRSSQPRSDAVCHLVILHELDQGEQERQRLAGSGACPKHHVLALQDRRDGLCLSHGQV